MDLVTIVHTRYIIGNFILEFSSDTIYIYTKLTKL